MNLMLFTGQDIEVSDDSFAKEFNEALVYQVVVAYRSKGRQGSKAQKSRSEVRGGGKKPWRQKGTGRARAGTNSSPIWRSGGRTFAAKPRDHAKKINRKMYRNAMCCIFSELVRDQRLIILESLEFRESKTKELVAKLAELKAPQALIITETVEKNLYLAARNIPKVEVVEPALVNPVSLIGFPKVIVTVPALRKLEEVLVNA